MEFLPLKIADRKDMAQRKMWKEMTVTSDGHHLNPTYVYKVVLLGSMAVGKSSLAFRYVKNSFRETMPTVGCSFFKQMIRLETANIMFEIWDTAGQEKYHSVCHLYYRGARAALLVYDISRKETFNRAKLWLRELEKDFLHDEIMIILVGNKTDLVTEREVTSEEGKEFARSKGLLHAETSAKSNHQVTDVFMAIAQKLLQQEQQKETMPVQSQSWKKSHVDLRAPNSNQIKKCCKS
ncbi:ras-related protein Rab-17 isoform A [Alligator mississippiensis]|uniref:Ras-related protein Rab-17 n=2 Tax=Alligator mississippiensis TaxID=8496 RepID=A0A151N9X7_ALLMI|nr:ras-related protein Rab-17 isoform A [Alligator mississippiensis]